jgi:outer membrane receptor protein involved in Fe transport
MTSGTNVAVAVRRALLASALAAMAGPALAQSEAPAKTEATPNLEEVVVTGSRIVRQDFEANSPIQTVTAEQIVANADVTLDTFLNTLPQVNPAGTTTSNNPGNGGQANINLRGLGPNRNLVLIDGRRAMVSASDLTVDLNTIPAALIENIEVITGGAGAVYGADAVAGVVNIKTKRNFEGLDLRAGYSNQLDQWDAREYSLSATLGGNFADGRGNAVLGFEFSQRDGLIKGQRPFSAIATSTTGAIPEGVARTNPSNGWSQAAVDSVFTRYGVAAGAVNAAANNVGFNLDGTLFSLGTFNSPLDVQNFKYPIDLSVNTRFYPDFYSYNFDAVNILTLPNKRRSFMGKFDYELGGGVETFALIGWTNYDSTTAIAPTPVPTGTGTASPTGTDPFQPKSALVTPGQTVSGSLVVPATNPFIPADLRALLNSRTGDDPRLVGAGANEPFLMGTRTLPLGLRASVYTSSITQYTLGFRGPIPVGNNWKWEVSANEGRTTIDQLQTGNVNAQNLQSLLESPTGTVAGCTYNIFGRQDLSDACKSLLEVKTQIGYDFRQRILQGFVTGNLGSLPAGDVGVVLGTEWREFKYEFNPGAAGGAIYGFNSQSPASGKNAYVDYFTEVAVPLLRNAPAAQSLDMTFGYRYSRADFKDLTKNASGDNNSSSYKVELSWQPIDYVRGRASYQRAVRAPNFAELFDGSTSAPQYFDPCSRGSAIRGGSAAAQVQALCTSTPRGAVGAAAYPNFAATPGGQITTQVGGNTELGPEKANTYTIGAVFSSPWSGAFQQLSASLDYYKIDINDAIITPDPNLYVADCYNYFGNNPSYSPTYAACQRVVRSANNIVRVNGTTTGGVLFTGLNGGKVQTDGIDLQVDYALPLPATFGQESSLRINMLLNYLLSFKRQDRPELPKLDYAGTVSYFGQGLGTSFPDYKINLTTGYTVGPVTADLRIRFIDKMENRAAVQFAGEPSFTGVPTMTYLDLGVTWRFMESGSLRVGVNNLTDKEPPLYSPNVQSGTDPSLYDVIGRRIFGQVNFKF